MKPDAALVLLVPAPGGIHESVYTFHLLPFEVPTARTQELHCELLKGPLGPLKIDSGPRIYG